MSSSQTTDWVHRLEVGTLDLFDLKTFENLRIEELVRELGESYPVRFLDRSSGHRREIGLARKTRRSNRWDSRLLLGCLLLTSESDLMTTLAAMTRLRFRPVRPTPGVFELTSGAGFSLYHNPDGWRIKLLKERTVSLGVQTLREKGWLLWPEGDGE